MIVREMCMMAICDIGFYIFCYKSSVTPNSIRVGYEFLSILALLSEAPNPGTIQGGYALQFDRLAYFMECSLFDVATTLLFKLK